MSGDEPIEEVMMEGGICANLSVSVIIFSYSVIISPPAADRRGGEFS